MKTILIFIIKIPFLMIKGIGKCLLMILKLIFGMLFGWIPDLDERMSGEDFEAYMQEVLKRNGYQDVKLTKRSGDYGVDILAKKKHKTYAIQCKFYAKPVGVSAVQQAYTGCMYYACDQAIVVTNHRFTAQAIALAESNGVELWDGEYVNHLKCHANARSLFHKSYQKEKFSPVHPYQSVLEILVNEGYAFTSLLVDKLHYSQEKAFYILEDLEFYDLVSAEDDFGIRDLYFLTCEEAMIKLQQ